METRIEEPLARILCTIHRLAEADGIPAPDDNWASLANMALQWSRDDPRESSALEPDEKKARVAYLMGSMPGDGDGSAIKPTERLNAIRAHLVRLAEWDGWCKLSAAKVEELGRAIQRDGDLHGFDGIASSRALRAADRNLATLYYWHHEPRPSAGGRGVVSLERYCTAFTYKQLKADPKRWALLGGLAADIAERVFDLSYDHAMRNMRGVLDKLDRCRQAMGQAARGDQVDWDRLAVPWELDGALDPRCGELVHPADFLTRHYLHYRIRKRWFPQALREALMKNKREEYDEQALDRQLDDRIMTRPEQPDRGVDRQEQERAEAAARLWFLMDWGDRAARSQGDISWKQLAFSHWGLPAPEEGDLPKPKQNEPRHIECNAGARFRYNRGLRRSLWQLEREGVALSLQLDFERDPSERHRHNLGLVHEVLPVAVSQVEAPGKERYALRRVLQHDPERGRPAMHLVSIANAKVDTRSSSGERSTIRQVDGETGAERQRRLLDLAQEAGRHAELLLSARLKRRPTPVGAAPIRPHATPAPRYEPSPKAQHDAGAGAPPNCGHGHERAMWLSASHGEVPSPSDLDEMSMVLETCGDCRDWWRVYSANIAATSELGAAMAEGLAQDEFELEDYGVDDSDFEAEETLWAELFAVAE